MHSKKTGFKKSFTAAIKRLFRARNIIIISDHKVDHVPLSAMMQVLLVVGMIGLFSGVSYITGGYMTARSAMHEKDRKIASTTLEKVRIGAEMDTLKHDLVRLSQNSHELSAYGKFLVEENVAGKAHDSSPVPGGSVIAQNSVDLADRIAYLEKRIKEIHDEDDHLITAIRQRTGKRISDFEDIISMTGLDSDKLVRMASENRAAANAAENTPPAPATSAGPARTVAAFPATDTARKDIHAHDETQDGPDQGGPFIPYDSTFTESDRELLANVDRLVLLHDVIEQLPLSQPIDHAQMTGPFGKRIDPLNGRWAIHPGLDLAGPTGSKIYCTSSGRVITAGHRAAYGNMVDIDHGFGIVTRYGHMSKIVVSEGQWVTKGQQVGVQGSTGRSTGPHLHYEVRINDRPVNPIKFLHAGEYVSENQ